MMGREPEEDMIFPRKYEKEVETEQLEEKPLDSQKGRGNRASAQQMRWTG